MRPSIFSSHSDFLLMARKKDGMVYLCPGISACPNVCIELLSKSGNLNTLHVNEWVRLKPIIAVAAGPRSEEREFDLTHNPRLFTLPEFALYASQNHLSTRFFENSRAPT